MSEINKLKKQADKVYAKMESMQRLSDSELKAKTDECICGSGRSGLQGDWLKTV